MCLGAISDGDTSRKSEAPMIRYSLVESTRNKCGRGREFSHDVRRFIGATEKCFTYGAGWGCALDAADQSLEKLASGWTSTNGDHSMVHRSASASIGIDYGFGYGPFDRGGSLAGHFDFCTVVTCHYR